MENQNTDQNDYQDPIQDPIPDTDSDPTSGSPTTFRQRVIDLRNARGWSQADLARKMGKQQPVLSKLESGRGSPPGLKLITAIATVFGITVDELIQNTDINPAIAPTDQVMETRRTTYNTLSDLVTDAFWTKILQGADPDISIYAFSVLSGIPKEDAREIAYPHGDAPSTTTLDHQARPIFARAMITGGVSPLWLTRICREIADDKRQKASDRLAAVKLAAMLSGALDKRLDEDLDSNSRGSYASRTKITDNEGRQLVIDTIHKKISEMGNGNSGIQIPRTEPSLPVQSEDEDPDLLPSLPSPSPSLVIMRNGHSN